MSRGKEAAVLVEHRMTRDVVTIRWDEPVAHAWVLMAQHRVRHLLVLDARRRLVGVVTEGDLREALVAIRRCHPGVAPRPVVVGFAMTTDPLTVAPDRPVHEAIRLMRSRALTVLPVVDGEQVVGILTREELSQELSGTPSGTRRAS